MGREIEFALWGVLVGTLLIGPFVWTQTGREVTKELVAKGAHVSKEKVSQWIKAGEAKRHKRLQEEWPD